MTAATPSAPSTRPQLLLPAHLRHDCGACRGLCCSAFAFDRLQGFGYDKPARERCRHLDDAHRCRIHDRLQAEGFEACPGFDCQGAGQRATAHFGGPGVALDAAGEAALIEAYCLLLPLHQALALLHLAGQRFAHLAASPDGRPRSPHARGRAGDPGHLGEGDARPAADAPQASDADEGHAAQDAQEAEEAHAAFSALAAIARRVEARCAAPPADLDDGGVRSLTTAAHGALRALARWAGPAPPVRR